MRLYQFILLTNSGESPGVSGEVTVFSLTIDNAGLFYFCHSGECILACISLMTNKIEYFFNYYWSFEYLLPCLSLLFIFLLGCVSFLMICKSFRYFLDMSPLSVKWTANIFLSVGFLSLFFFFFDDKKVQILM